MLLRAGTLEGAAVVHKLVGDAEGAVECLRAAIADFDAKGSLVGAARGRACAGEPRSKGRAICRSQGPARR